MPMHAIRGKSYGSPLIAGISGAYAHLVDSKVGECKPSLQLMPPVDYPSSTQYDVSLLTKW